MATIIGSGQRAGDCDAEARSDKRVTSKHNKGFKPAARDERGGGFFFL